MMMKYFLTLLLILFSLACFSAVYMQTDKNGHVTYSDVPENNAQSVILPTSGNSISLPVNNLSPAISTPQTPATSSVPSAGEATRKPYSVFMMTDPTDQETFQNQRDIPITIEVEPSLQEGDKIQLYLDGKAVGEATANLDQLVLHQVDRGQHQLSATLIDSAGHTLKQVDAITIFIHYSAIPTGSGAIKTNL